jgi:hypothetical protein
MGTFDDNADILRNRAHAIDHGIRLRLRQAVNGGANRMLEAADLPVPDSSGQITDELFDRLAGLLRASDDDRLIGGSSRGLRSSRTTCEHSAQKNIEHQLSLL